MGISLPSLYSASGDKEIFSVTVRAAYVAVRAPGLATVDARPDAQTVIRKFLEGAARAVSQTPGLLRASRMAMSGDHTPISARRSPTRTEHSKQRLRTNYSVLNSAVN
jgi:hypothetical protein